MANNYTDSSSWLDIPADKVDAANAIIERVIAKLEADEATCGYCGCLVSRRRKRGPRAS